MAALDREHFFSGIRSVARKLLRRRRSSDGKKRQRSSSSSTPNTSGSNHSTSFSSSASSSSSTGRNDIRRVFAEYDRDADGRISLADLTHMVRAVGDGSCNSRGHIPTEADAAAEAQAMMEVVDLDRDGYIGLREFETLMMMPTATPPPAAMSPHSTSSSVDYDDHLSFASYRGNQECAGNQDDLRLAFAVYDHDGDGVITADEIHAVLCRVMETTTITLADCRNMVRAVDRDGDGVVGFQDFAAMTMA